jgi:hypothetical protein
MNDKKFFSRKDPRISLEIHIQLSVPGVDNIIKKIQASTKDISKEGLFIETPELLPLNTVLDLTFHLPDNTEAVNARGVAIWQKSEPSGGLYQQGLRILEMDKKSKEFLANFFDSANYYGWFY